MGWAFIPTSGAVLGKIYLHASIQACMIELQTTTIDPHSVTFDLSLGVAEGEHAAL